MPLVNPVSVGFVIAVFVGYVLGSFFRFKTRAKPRVAGFIGFLVGVVALYLVGVPIGLAIGVWGEFYVQGESLVVVPHGSELLWRSLFLTTLGMFVALPSYVLGFVIGGRSRTRGAPRSGLGGDRSP